MKSALERHHSPNLKGKRGYSNILIWASFHLQDVYPRNGSGPVGTATKMIILGPRGDFTGVSETQETSALALIMLTIAVSVLIQYNAL